MKVLNLHCAAGHTFEGWFANEADYQSQHARGLLCCPVCNTPDVHKGLSAPRLNLRGGQEPAVLPAEPPSQPAATTEPAAPAQWVRAWLELSRHLVAHSDDVGERFTQEARKMHYGDAPERSIRGQATAADVVELLDEGIDVLPLALPHASKHTLQ